MLRVFVGFDQRQVNAYQVCVRSLNDLSSMDLRIEPLMEPHLRALGIYARPHLRLHGQLWDTVSEQPMSTEFSVARFAVPLIAPREGWVLFCDPDILWRGDVAELFALADPRFAVMVVKHDQKPVETVKMDGQAQRAYERKNWSSVMLINTSHREHQALSIKALNNWHRDELHALHWLPDEVIGELPPEWNHLVGVTPETVDPKAVHFTLGLPDLPEYHHVRFADEWRAKLRDVRAA